MVLAALTLKPEEFAVGVDLFGISNWVRTLESIPAWWEAQRTSLYKEIGDPVKDKEKLLAVSPLFHADQVKRPLMVLQGANDPRVIKAESDDIVAAVKKNGVPVEYVVFADEGHGFTKRKNQIEGYRGILQFLDAHLKGAAGPKAAPPADGAELTGLLKEFLAGASRNDPQTHDRFWADDLVYTRSSGRRMGKAEIMADLRAPSAPRPAGPATTYTAEDIRIQQYGDAAVVAFRLVGTEEKAGKAEVTNYLNTGTFVKRNGRWQAVAWQATRVPRPGEEGPDAR